MSAFSLPQWHSFTKSSQGRISCRHNGSFHSFSSIPGMGILFGSFFLIGLVFYTGFLSPHGPPLLSSSGSYGLFQLDTGSTQDLGSNKSTPTNHAASLPTSDEAPSSPSDVLSLEQIRDIVAPTRGFFTRDYSLNLGWNNMQYVLDSALLQANLLNRTLVIPSFVYARACEYHIEACADYAVMVNRGDAVGSEEWRELPIEKQMAFRIPISIMIDLPHLRAQHPVITVSEYLRLHGLDPEAESSHGHWQRELYHASPNVFEFNKTKTPSLFVVENHWYDPPGSTRVDSIPQAMKDRGNWERYSPSQSQETSGYWPFVVPTDVSRRLGNVNSGVLDWDAAKRVLSRLSSKLEPEVDLSDDKAVEDTLNVNGWEVLHTFFSAGWDLDKALIQPIRQVVPRSSIRGFKDDYYHVDTDVVLIEGEVHVGRKPGAMRFTEDRARSKFASVAVHSFIQPPPILALAEILAARMRQLNDGRLWMGAHIRRGDFVRVGWVMEKKIEDHVNRVKNRLEIGRSVLEHLENVTTYDIENVESDMEQITCPPPLPDDRFYVATDERDPDALRVISDAGGVFLAELLEMEDRRAFGWPLMLTDVRALVDQLVLAHSAYFYGHTISSYAGRIANMRAARGADYRTTLLD